MVWARSAPILRLPRPVTAVTLSPSKGEHHVLNAVAHELVAVAGAAREVERGAKAVPETNVGKQTAAFDRDDEREVIVGRGPAPVRARDACVYQLRRKAQLAQQPCEEGVEFVADPPARAVDDFREERRLVEEERPARDDPQILERDALQMRPLQRGERRGGGRAVARIADAAQVTCDVHDGADSEAKQDDSPLPAHGNGSGPVAQR